MTSELLYSIISKVLNVPLSEINDESSPNSIESWDSFTGYILLDEIESNFNVHFSLDDSLNIQNVKDFKKFLLKNGISL